MDRKIKVLAYCDSPTVATGFGTVSRNIFEALHRTGRYDVEVLGINYWGDPHPYPYRIWPTAINPENDPYGRQKVVNMIPQMKFDILFVLQDTFIVNFLPTLIPHLTTNRREPFKTLMYFPIDSVLKEEWGKNIEVLDNLVAYCEFGKTEALKTLPNRNIDVIYHGVNTNDYYPLPDEDVKKFREQFFGPLKDKWIVTNVNRNQQRKDIPRFLMAFKEFKKVVPDAVAYCHMATKDQGWKLDGVCDTLGFDMKKDVIFPQNFGPNQGYPKDVVNKIYNASDVVVSATLAEGMGLAWLEAMATRTPIIMPDNTAMSEFITEDRGYLVKSGGDLNLLTILPNDNEVIRNLIDVNELTDTLINVHSNKEEAKKKAENAYKWVTTSMDWQKHIGAQWVALFDKVHGTLEDTNKEMNDVITSIGNLTPVIESEEL